VSEQPPDRTADDDDLPGPDESHGSDLDAGIGGAEAQPEQAPGADEAGP
jgi:hypothetical protein